MSEEVFQIVFRAWLGAFVLSLVLEVPIFVLLARSQVPAWRAAIAGALGTCLTHPLLWFVWVHVFDDYNLYILTGELLVATIETLIFWALARPISFRRALAAAFLANGISYAVGLVTCSGAT